METTRAVHYIGSDQPFFSRLKEMLGAAGFQVIQVDLQDCVARDNSNDFRRAIILDANVAKYSGLEQLTNIRHSVPGIPIIVVGSISHQPLTQFAVAKMDRADAIFFKPLTDMSPMIEVLHSAFARLARIIHPVRNS